MGLKIVAISDVHCKWDKLQIPECDILISAGDYSFKGEPHVVRDFHKWLNKQEAGYIISVQGNHELQVESNFQLSKEMAEAACPGVHFIDHGLVEIEGIKIFGSAWTPFFHDWAWNAHRTLEQAQAFGRPYIKDKWDQIPDDVDVLITHGPPYGILDELEYVNGMPKGEHVGCDHLLEAVKRIKPDVHIFGHIHCGHGQKHIDGTSFYNAAICDEIYMPSNPITVIEL